MTIEYTLTLENLLAAQFALILTYTILQSKVFQWARTDSEFFNRLFLAWIPALGMWYLALIMYPQLPL